MNEVVRSNPVKFTVSKILLLLAVLCGLLLTFHAPVPFVDLVGLTLSFGFAAFLFPELP